MIVENTGYLSFDKVCEMNTNNENFSILKTHKNTIILLKDDYNIGDNILYKPKEDRLPWKIVEGKKIVRCNVIFNSKKDNFLEFILKYKFNQIMSYKIFTLN